MKQVFACTIAVLLCVTDSFAARTLDTTFYEDFNDPAAIANPRFDSMGMDIDNNLPTYSAFPNCDNPPVDRDFVLFNPNLNAFRGYSALGCSTVLQLWDTRGASPDSIIFKFWSGNQYLSDIKTIMFWGKSSSDSPYTRPAAWNSDNSNCYEYPYALRGYLLVTSGNTAYFYKKAAGVGENYVYMSQQTQIIAGRWVTISLDGNGRFDLHMEDYSGGNKYDYTLASMDNTYLPSGPSATRIDTGNFLGMARGCPNAGYAGTWATDTWSVVSWSEKPAQPAPPAPPLRYKKTAPLGRVLKPVVSE